MAQATAAQIRNPASPPPVPTGVEGTAWAWRGDQWVRSYSAAGNQAPPAAAPAPPPPIDQRFNPPPSATNESLFINDAAFNAFSDYLRTLSPAERDRILRELQVERDQATFFQWYGQQSSQVQQFLQYLGGVDAAGRQERIQSLIPRQMINPPGTTPPGTTPRPAMPDSISSAPKAQVQFVEDVKPTQMMSEQSARAIIREFLSGWGLGGLEDMLYERVVADQDWSDVRLITEVRKTPEYRARFPGMSLREQQGRVAISEREYLADERAYRQLMQQAGLPTGFYDDPSDFAKFIGGDVSPDELGRRIQQGYQAIAQADPSVRDAMRRFYGVTDGELAAYMLDPGRAESIIMQQAATAQLGAAAARMGFGESADRLAAERMQRLGVTEQEAERAYGTLAGAQELLRPLEFGEDTLDVTETAIGLTGRDSPEALQRLQTQARRRTARFQGGGSFATQGADVVGLQQA